MSQSTKTLWVVLVDKNPVGPFSEEEIREQLADGKLRPNDIAFKVEPGKDRASSEWKFLWQFGEFERRRPTEELPEEPKLAISRERRTFRSEPEVRAALAEELPSEFTSLPTLVSQALPKEPEAIRYQRGEQEGIERDGYFVEMTKAPPLAPKQIAIFSSLTVFAVLLLWKLLAGFGSGEVQDRKIASEPSKKAQHKSPSKKAQRPQH